MAYLVIQSGKHRGRKIELRPGEDLLIGRDPECRIRLASTDVSRRHCVVRMSDKGVIVKDLGSRNGTFVDGFTIEKVTLLRPGSILQIGPLQFLLPGVKEASAKPAQSDDDASDDDITAWLTADSETTEPDLGDSTELSSTLTAPPPEPLVKSLDDHPDARRAAEIIQRHRQSSRGSE